MDAASGGSGLTHVPQAQIRRRDPLDPAFKSVEQVQRGRIVLDVAETDLAVAEARLGPFHETTWYFRQSLQEARRAWERLRSRYGTAALEAALAEPPVLVLPLVVPDRPTIELLAIAGKTYRVERIVGTELAPRQFRLTRLPLKEDEPYYVCRLRNGSTQCDCAEWTYRIAESDLPGARCKHIDALIALDWL